MTAETQPLKILIGMPTFGLDPNPNRWLATLLVILQDLKRAGVEYGFNFQYRKTIHKAENEIIRCALVNNFTHILRLDDDIWGVQPGDVMKLLNADKDFISAVMYIRGFPYMRCAFVKKDPKMTLQECEKGGRDTLIEADGEGIVPVDLTAFPLTLFKTSIYSKMKYPWFDAKEECTADAQFCQKCLDLDIQPYAHMDIQINHMEVTPWNRLFLFNSDARQLLMKRKLNPAHKNFKAMVELFGEDGCKDLYILKGTGKEPKIG